MNGKIGRQLYRWIGLTLVFILLAPAALAETAAEIAMHPYVDEIDGTTFMLPDGWTEESEPLDGASNIAAHTEPQDSPVGILFFHMCQDTWPEVQSYFPSRAAVDNIMNDTQTISAVFGGEKVEEVEFNGIKYFKLKTESTWQYFRLQNGYMHMFQFSVDTDDPYYAYFEAIMNSVVFPEIE